MLSTINPPTNKKDLIAALQKAKINKVLVRDDIERQSLASLSRDVNGVFGSGKEKVSVIIVRYRE